MTSRQIIDFTTRRVGLLSLTGLMALPILAILAALLTQNEVSWARLFATTLPSYIINTGLLMIMVAVLAGSMGVITAWAVASCEFPGRTALSWLLILPLAAPAYIIAYVYTDLMEYYGPLQSGLRALFGWSGADYIFPNIRNLPGAALMLSLVLYPYVYLLARTAFAAQSQGQWQAARSLGLSPRRAFIRVALPAARPAIAGGLALVLMETLADFGVADFFAVPTFSTGIFRAWLAEGNRPAAMKLAAFMLLIVILLVTLESLSRRGRTSSEGAPRSRAPRMRLSKPLAALTSCLCVLPVLFGFFIPIGRLAFLALTSGDAQGQTAFTSYAVNSFSTAAVVALIVTLIAISLAYMRRNQSGRLMKASIKLSTLGYALPGAMLAIGLLYPLGAFDQLLTRFAVAHFAWSGGLILTGTSIALIYALAIRFLTVSFNSVSSGFAAIPPSMDAAARSLGATPKDVVRRIHVPLLKSSLTSGAILVFIDVMRELPATLILRPFNFETLATRVYWLANDERLAEASTAALLIILIGVVPIIWLNHIAANNKAGKTG